MWKNLQGIRVHANVSGNNGNLISHMDAHAVSCHKKDQQEGSADFATIRSRSRRLLKTVDLVTLGKHSDYYSCLLLGWRPSRFGWRPSLVVFIVLPCSSSSISQVCFL